MFQDNETVRAEKRMEYFRNELADKLQDLAAERRDHRTTRKVLMAYRVVALAGWASFVAALILGA